jgi:hypothetical protein
VKAFQALLVIGGILVIIGIYVVYPPFPISGNYAASIPTGNYFYRITFNILKADHILGTFSEASGNSVTVYIFNAAQYDAYRNGGFAVSLFSTSGPTGSFSASISSPGDYYLILQHGASNTNQIQNVQVSYVIDGMNPVFLGSGIALIAAGIALGYLGYIKKRRTVAPRSVTDVILFDRPQT